eukprot:TRINITY_DN41564_c0_g1_i1.p1 TRINITY_DN41564_c0_g1~~TRINITY_DN41564_c0_g1_i1.p1  ORF type:complete len:138 (-),score=1.96 TRINITY_DN41564_c0_g1_i1:27-440(-)
MSKSQYEVIQAEYRRAEETTIEPLPQLAGQDGWGKQGTEYENVHFKSSIAKSYFLLEHAAVHRDEMFERASSHTIRAYVKNLSEKFPGLDRQLWEDYIETYECARFSQDEFNERQFQRFMSGLVKVLHWIDNCPIEC